MRPGSFQPCPVTEQGPAGTTWDTGSSVRSWERFLDFKGESDTISLKQAAQRGCGYSFPGNTQNMPGSFCLQPTLGNPIQQGGWPDSPQVPFKPYNCVILWKSNTSSIWSILWVMESEEHLFLPHSPWKNIYNSNKIYPPYLRVICNLYGEINLSRKMSASWQHWHSWEVTVNSFQRGLFV